MKFLIEKDYNQLSRRAAQIIAEEIKKKPNLVMCLPTGSSPVGTYKQLAQMVKEDGLDFSKVATFNLDEYIGLNPDNENSYHYFMNANFFDYVNIKKENIHIPDGCADNVDEECKRYDSELDKYPYKDVLLTGIGINGHIGFNEPDNKLYARTHIINLTDNTISANARFFGNNNDNVPKSAITMGVADIMHFKKVVLVANGIKKAPIIKELMTSSMIDTHNTSTLLNLNSDVTIIIDEEAASLL